MAKVKTNTKEECRRIIPKRVLHLPFNKLSIATPHWAYNNSVTPTRSPYAENCLYKARGQPACKTSNTQNEVYRLVERRYYHRDEVLYGRLCHMGQHDMRIPITAPYKITHIRMEKVLLISNIVVRAFFVECEAGQQATKKITKLMSKQMKIRSYRVRTGGNGEHLRWNTSDISTKSIELSTSYAICAH